MFNKTLLRCLSLFLLFLVFSCNEIKSSSDVLNSGVVITFDDDFTNEWSQVHIYLRDYNWKATFFVSDYEALDSSQVHQLLELQRYGHEIGAHGLNHLNAPETINQIGTQEYLDIEILPQLDLMQSDNFTINTFAYPYGARNQASDSLLLEHFKLVRGTTYGDTLPSKHNCFYANNKLVYGLEIDSSYPHFSLDYLSLLLDFAKENNKFIILYAHRPVKEVNDDYETDYLTLQFIAEYIKSNNMQFLTFSELDNLSN